MFSEYPEIMTVAEMAEALHIGKNSAYKLINDNIIGHKKVGKKILVPKICVINYVKSALYIVSTL